MSFTFAPGWKEITNNGGAGGERPASGEMLLPRISTKRITRDQRVSSLRGSRRADAICPTRRPWLFQLHFSSLLALSCPLSGPSPADFTISSSCTFTSHIQQGRCPLGPNHNQYSLLLSCSSLSSLAYSGSPFEQGQLNTSSISTANY